MAGYQLDAFFNDASLSAYFAPPKAGKTVGALSRFYEECVVHGGPAKNFWYVAPVYQQSEIAFARMKASIGYLIKRGLAKMMLTERSVELWHGGKMWFKSAKDWDNLYGEDVYFVVFDEAGRAPEDSWTAVQTTLGATKGKCLMIGNMPGKKNWAYQLYESIMQGDHEDAQAGLITLKQAEQAGIADMAQIEKLRRRMPEYRFRQLYHLVPGEDADNPFGTDHIEYCIQDKPIEGVPIYWGLDFAKARDYTVLIGLSDDLDVVYFERFQEASWDATVNRAYDTLMRYGNPICYADETGVGAYPVEQLQDKGANVKAIQFTGQYKQELMGQLAVVIQSHKMSYPDGEIPRELHNFEYHYTPTGVSYRAAEGYFDDCVDALALGVAAWNGGVWMCYAF